MDIDNIIKSIDMHLDLDTDCKDCPYSDEADCFVKLMSDIKTALRGETNENTNEDTV